ncbi:NADP-dependent 3-hydroxy acid dehydrogenase YdfG [Actinoalloteichus hoggarensis]|uniref:Putative oxidoreductase n=1 Tax=Actinoalloteichus hoggarensis TaxID=1470176 RepID=A0A221WBV1_9PSEU|nr:SDR family oxidoreductase [Actinoalloteichus hoggarensis]ASO23121.1 putative oxidoreductase [Actinoalloteichus hoggarensis]MBB5922727.1 NADP-dependent 3-hydroxy acid dehydrogenase YdfG [Actinoalloteichus hoggarensis]
MTSRPLALVTGASRGVGAAVARALAPTHDLLLGGRDRQRLLPLVEELPTADPWIVELTDGAAVAEAVADIASLDVLVHSAGIVELGSIAETSADSWRRTFDVNVIAVAELTRLLLPALRSARGHVVLVNSGAGLRANPGWGSYAAGKFALRAFADVLRAEEADAGVRVTSVHPGRVATDMQRAVRAAEGGDFEPERYLRPQTVADVVATAVRLPADGQLNEIVLRPRS